MLHICFDESAYCTIRHAMKLGLIEKEKVILFDDDLSVGNISDCRNYQYRKNVIYNISFDYIDHIDDNEIKKGFDDFYKVLLQENDFIIWYAPNPRDYCNMYYIVNLVANKNIRVVECIKKELKNITLYYKWVGEVIPEDMPMLLNKARELNCQEKNEYSNKWKLLVSENGPLRGEVSGEIRTIDEDYYDNLVLERVPIKTHRIARIVGDFMGMDKPCLRDWFIVWRIKHLAEIGCVEIDYRCKERFMFNDIRKINQL